MESMKMKIKFMKELKALVCELLLPANNKNPEAIEIYNSLNKLMKFKDNYMKFQKEFENVLKVSKDNKLNNKILAHSKLKFYNSFCDYFGKLLDVKLYKIKSVILCIHSDIKALVETQKFVCQNMMDYYDSVKDKETPEKLNFEELKKKLGITDEVCAKMQGKKFGGYVPECSHHSLLTYTENNIVRNVQDFGDAISWLQENTKPFLGHTHLKSYNDLWFCAKNIDMHKNDFLQVLLSLENMLKNPTKENKETTQTNFEILPKNIEWFGTIFGDANKKIKDLTDYFKSNEQKLFHTIGKFGIREFFDNWCDVVDKMWEFVKFIKQKVKDKNTLKSSISKLKKEFNEIDEYFKLNDKENLYKFIESCTEKADYLF